MFVFSPVSKPRARLFEMTLLCLGLCVSTQPAVALDTQPNGTPPPTASFSDRESVTLELTGDLRPSASADLAFKIGGQLVSIKVERGQKVKKGQLLAVLSDGEARAQLEQSEAAVAQARAQHLLAKDNEARAETLVAANAAPDSQAIAVKLQSEIARAALKQASAARDLASENLANHQLRAPFDGVIVTVPDGTGQIVGAGMPLFRVEALDSLVLRTSVAESDLEHIHVGDTVTIETGTGKKVVGKVRLVLRSLDSSRRAPVEVDVPNKDQSLIAGSYVRAYCRAQ